MSEAKKTPDLIAYNVNNRGETAFWNRVGAAWKTKSGGYTIKLEALPVNGEIVLHPPKED
jgi:hypothetical protein